MYGRYGLRCGGGSAVGDANMSGYEKDKYCIIDNIGIARSVAVQGL